MIDALMRGVEVGLKIGVAAVVVILCVALAGAVFDLFSK